MYAKVFSSIFDGSLATRGPWQALVTFQQLLVLADRHGIVDMTAEAIARRTTLPLEVIEIGLAELEKPDPDSRRPDHEGRRIVRLNPDRAWGWMIVNYAHYAAIRSSEERRDQQRLYMRKWRAEKSAAPATDEPADDTPIVCKLPLRTGKEFEIRQSWVDQLAPLYPGVAIPQTLHEMRGWLLGNIERRKTERGIRRFVTSWLQREQDKYGAQAA